MSEAEVPEMRSGEVCHQKMEKHFARETSGWGPSGACAHAKKRILFFQTCGWQHGLKSHQRREPGGMRGVECAEEISQ